MLLALEDDISKDDPVQLIYTAPGGKGESDDVMRDSIKIAKKRKTR